MPKNFFIGINDIYFLPKTLTEKIFDKNNNECVISYNLEFKSNLGSEKLNGKIQNSICV